eukprot:scaffold52729_cov472-Isochrysis_galbana.AAC.1
MPLHPRAHKNEKPVLMSLHVSTASAESARHVSTAARESSPAPSRATRPLREDSTTREAPLRSSQVVVIDASPPLPPVTKWASPTCSCTVPATRSTTLPAFNPCCSHRKADAACRSMSNNAIGNPCTEPRSARIDNKRNVSCVHHGACSIALSSASTT